MKRILILMLCVCLVIPSLGGCVKSDEQTKSYLFMGTVIKITLLETNADEAEPIFARCGEILSELDALWSRTAEGSDVSRINRNEIFTPDPRTVNLIRSAIAVTNATDGAFDITVAPLVTLWETCEEAGRLPTEAEMTNLLSLVGIEGIAIDGDRIIKASPEVQIDLGGIGKGAAIDALIDYLESCPVQGGLVSFGSNVAVFGKKASGEPFHVAIRDPKDPNGVIGSLTMQSGEVLSVSGDYERYVTIDGVRYHHILSPQTGYPAETGLASVAVVAKDGAEADALSTALFVMGMDAADAFYRTSAYSFEAVFVLADNTTATTAGIMLR